MSQSKERVKVSLDSASLFGALDAARQARGLQWKDVADETGVSASTLTRIAQGKRPDIDGFASLTSWLGNDPRLFFEGEIAEPDPVGTFVGALFRANPDLGPHQREALKSLATGVFQLAADKRNRP